MRAPTSLLVWRSSWKCVNTAVLRLVFLKNVNEKFQLRRPVGASMTLVVMAMTVGCLRTMLKPKRPVKSKSDLAEARKTPEITWRDIAYHRHDSSRVTRSCGTFVFLQHGLEARCDQACAYPTAPNAPAASRATRSPDRRSRHGSAALPLPGL
jgi:hypothetical protein